MEERQKNTFKKIGEIAKKVVIFILNPRFLLCFGIGWIITNGWSYVMLGIGTFYGIEWMVIAAGAYLAFLWLPISPEKIVTVAIAMFLLRIFFPKDEKTLGVLRQMHKKAKEALLAKKKKRKQKRSKTE